MRNYIKIAIGGTAAEGEILLAELSENGFYAFEQNENILIAYIKEEDFDEEKFRFLLPENTSYESSVIADRNWNEEWESQLQPVTVNDFIGIRASFHKTVGGVKHEIIITPKMSFGTGHHATTYLMMEQMGKINFKNKTVLDFGTGTGILAILAEKLSAASIIAIDNDEWSVKNALENIEANRCKRINVEERNDIDGIPSVNIILANINFNVLTENAESLSKLLQPGSVLLISGFLLSDEDAVGTVFAKNHFRKNTRSQKSGWVTVEFVKC